MKFVKKCPCLPKHHILNTISFVFTNKKKGGHIQTPPPPEVRLRWYINFGVILYAQQVLSNFLSIITI